MDIEGLADVEHLVRQQNVQCSMLNFQLTGLYYLYFMVEWKTITWFVMTLLLMGFFAGIEMAYYSANRLTIELKRKQGGTAAHLLTKFIDEPANFIGTTLIGFNIFLVFFQYTDQYGDAARMEVFCSRGRYRSYLNRNCDCHFPCFDFC